MTKEKKKADKPYYKISSLAKGLEVLEILAEQKALSVTEVARLLGQNRSASHRFLATLRDMGYVVQDAQSRYRLSMRLFELGHKIDNMSEIRSIARSYMRKLVDIHGETVNLGRMDGIEMVTIDVVQGTQVIKYDAQIGERSPAHTLAMGKAILAFSSEETQRTYLDRAEFRQITPNTLPDRASFEKELRLIHKRGYAIDNEEWAIGLRCIAAPLFDLSHPPFYAISVSGPTTRITGSAIKKIAKNLIEMCHAISGRIGKDTFL